MTRERQVVGIVMLGLAAAAMLARWPWLDVPMISDEGGYSYVARFWSDTHQLYRDIPFDRPQGIFLIYQTILALFGSSVAAIRLAAAVWNAITTLVVFLFARESTRSTPPAAGAALLFGVVSTSSSIEGFTANAELFAGLPLTLAAWCTWRRRWLAAGVLAGIATIIKPIGLAGLVLAVAWKLTHERRRPGFAALMAGYLGVLAIALAHVATLSWSAFWEQQTQKASVVILDHHLLLAPQVRLVVASAWHTAPAWAGLAWLAGLGAAHTDRTTRRFGVLWTGASVFGVAMGGEWSWH
jgi:4-amino-4-deoxy-L-arabinose transferase-like glycosyltransferase